MHQTLLPPALKQGDTVALVAPASTPNKLRIDRAIERLNALGLKTKTYRDIFERRGYLAGTDEVRADEFNRAFRDTSVHAVFAARGGYGAVRILDRIDYDQIRDNPKIFMGFSEITALHLAIGRQTGLITFHSPHPNDGLGSEEGWDAATGESFWRACSGSVTLESTPEHDSAGFDLVPPGGKDRWRTIVAGDARGRLIGGNMAVALSLMGTPYEIDAKEKILFLEDIDEKPYRVDRALSQLRLAGTLRGVKGVLLGHFTGCVPGADEPSLSLDDVFSDYLSELGVPVIAGFPAGHARPNVTLPLGTMVEIDTDAKRVATVESCIRF